MESAESSSESSCCCFDTGNPLNKPPNSNNNPNSMDKMHEELLKNAELLSLNFNLDSIKSSNEVSIASSFLEIESESISTDLSEFQGGSGSEGEQTPTKTTTLTDVTIDLEKSSDLEDQDAPESKQLKLIKAHNESLSGSDKKMFAKKFQKLCDKLEDFLLKLSIPDDSGIKGKAFEILHPLVPGLSEIFHSKGFDSILVGIIVFVCKFRNYPRTGREIISKLGHKEKPVNRNIQKLQEIFPQQAVLEVDPKSFIFRVVSSLCIESEGEAKELIETACKALDNMRKIRMMVHEHALTLASFCVFLACLGKKNDYADPRKLSEAAGISKITLLNVYRKYLPFQNLVLDGIGEILALKEI